MDCVYNWLLRYLLDILDILDDVFLGGSLTSLIPKSLLLLSLEGLHGLLLGLRLKDGLFPGLIGLFPGLPGILYGLLGDFFGLLLRGRVSLSSSL